MRLLPRTFAAMRKRRDLEHQRQELLVGILAANVANYSTWKLKEPATPADFMPSRIGREETDEETMIRLMRSMSSDAITTN